ncbi:MAG: Gfo/Idh/MocA family oxidoreductase [Verrucomicrobia bacterium]|nr:Gfo/Idh/MocA family oxidoreductase [Verrucomicrobiota bacterium]
MNSHNHNQDLTRRDFIKGGSAATLMGLLGGIELTARAAEAEAPAVAVAKTRCAVIGLGSWGREIVSTLSRIPGAEVAAVCDTYGASLRRAARSAPGAAQVDDYRKILADDSVPAVIVATPTHLHREIVLNALEAGKQVYCEAPLAHTIDDARAIALAARKASSQHFQSGLQLRADKHRAFVLNFIRSGARGKAVAARAQYLKKQSWRQAAPSPEREGELNWRLNKETSIGMVGELGIHQLDASNWIHDALPVSVTGFGSMLLWRDGRELPDTSHLVVEYGNGVRLIQTCTLANSFEGEYEVYYGTDGTVTFMGSKSWLFKEADAPLLGWEVYARKDSFYQETGIALMMDASKQKSLTQEVTDVITPLQYALENFLRSASDVRAAVEDFTSNYGEDEEALKEHMATVPRQVGAGYLEGYQATVLAIKAHEAISKNQRVELPSSLFELA